MGADEQTIGSPDEPAPGAGGADQPQLRRSFFGYRREDVENALTARQAELAELRQDVAALWLAFAQHDRMIRSALEPGGRGPEPEGSPVPAADESAPLPAPSVESPSAVSAEGSPTIGRQLSDLDEVLAAIEMATRTLEQTYGDEISKPGPEDATAEPTSAKPEDGETGESERPGGHGSG